MQVIKQPTPHPSFSYSQRSTNPKPRRRGSLLERERDGGVGFLEEVNITSPLFPFDSYW